MAPPRIPIETRFWSKVDQSGGPDACWPWLAGTDKDGYGLFKMPGRSGKQERAARVAWTLARGPIPDGQRALHHCDTPACCNPYGDRHIFLGTDADNNRDMLAKGRQRYVRGEDQHNAKLRAADVIRIRELRSGGWTLSRIGREFGISISAVSLICLRRHWRHVA